MDTERTYGEVATRARDSFQGVERIPGARKQDPILTAHNIRREFGGIVAVDVDHFEVQKGSITALIGPNGAGKTTFFNLLTGFDKPNTGSWSFESSRHDQVRRESISTRAMNNLPLFVALLALISMFMPWAYLGDQRFTGITGIDGVWGSALSINKEILGSGSTISIRIVLVGIILLVLLNLLKQLIPKVNENKKLEVGLYLILCISFVFSCVTTFSMNRQVNDLASELDLGFSGPVLSFGPAFGLAVAIFALLLFYWNDRKVRSGAQKVRPESLAVLGMVRTFQLTKSLTKLSVIENMRLGATDQKGEKWWNGLFAAVWKGQEAEITERADELLARFKMDHMRDEYAGSLSGGQRKLLEMARALMTNPTLVMLDEPMAGVNPALKQSLNQHIRGLRDDGMTVLFVEHDMDMVHDVSDWVIVMAEGRIIAEGTPDDISTNPAVIDAYLGTRQGQSLLEDE